MNRFSGYRARVRARWDAATVAQRCLLALLIVFAVKGVAITFIHDPFTGHDEVAHYAYLQVVATEGRVPLIPDPDMWRAPSAVANPAGFDRIPASFWRYCRFSTQDWSGCGDNQCPDSCYLHADKTDGKIMPAGWIYTANHPPLYYLFMTPLYWLTSSLSPDGQLYWLRLAAIPLGMVVVGLAYATVRQLFPNDPRQFLAITVPAVVAFQPQISYEAAMLNNDILAIALASCAIWLVAVGLRRGFPIWSCVLIGAALGLALLAKSTAITVAVVVAAGMILGFGWRHWRAWMPRGALSAGVAALLIWPWYLYMYRTYGDFTALNRIHALQWWNYSDVSAPTIWSQLTDHRFFWQIWGQTWGGFGWNLIQLPDYVLLPLFCVALFSVAGVAIATVRARNLREAIGGAVRGSVGLPPSIAGIVMLTALCLVSYAAILQFGTGFQGTQARYAFPAVNAAAILVMVGVRSWFPRRWLPGVAAVTIVALAILTVVIYADFVIPWNLDHHL